MSEISYLKLLVPTAGPAPARDRAEFVMKLAIRIHAEVLALHIVKCLTDQEKCNEGNEALKIFEDAGIKNNIKVNNYLEEGELLPTIIKFAEEKDVDLIIMGTSEDGRMIAEWIVSDLRYKTDLPVVIDPHGLGSIANGI
jgi:nucleotide-binding universal stress UspA family protein